MAVQANGDGRLSATPRGSLVMDTTGVGSTAPTAATVISVQRHTGRRSGNVDDALLVWSFTVNRDWEPTVSTNVTWPVVPGTNTNPDGHVPVGDVAQAMCEIRRRSGLDWGELAEMFGVSREDVCNWASGGIVDGSTLHVVRSTLKAIRHIDRGTSHDTRAYLRAIEGDTDGSAFELLQQRRFSEVMARHKGNVVPSHIRPNLSEEAQELRRPESVIALLQADQRRPDIATSPRIIRVMQAPPVRNEE